MSFPPNTDNPDRADLLVISPGVIIPKTELSFRTSRSGGPGGQHVNKVETRVELLFDLANSPSLTDEQRARLLDDLAPWLDTSGMLHIISAGQRSQYRNREEAIARFVLLLQQALRPRKTRKRTRVSRAAREERLQDKKQRGATKSRRRGRPEEE